ncbi:hypothetical protein GLOIN_2v1885507 [Rhizophagus clarus]|uniref:Uncharacterized protein n=1 Tax=Rhizophagus clarus TaxID=94130 RepID=A0A8H3M4R0_9GLOM|nr:hypothetical protein GLOIN_2v1885507 [Rhizophagus clarus]
MGNLVDVYKLINPQLASLPYYDGQEEKDDRKIPSCSSNYPYNANNAINNEPEFLNWLRGKYHEVMVGTNQDAMRALMTERFSSIDTADTYEKRIKPYA